MPHPTGDSGERGVYFLLLLACTPLPLFPLFLATTPPTRRPSNLSGGRLSVTVEDDSDEPMLSEQSSGSASSKRKRDAGDSSFAPLSASTRLRALSLRAQATAAQRVAQRDLDQQQRDRLPSPRDAERRMLTRSAMRHGGERSSQPMQECLFNIDDVDQGGVAWGARSSSPDLEDLGSPSRHSNEHRAMDMAEDDATSNIPSRWRQRLSSFIERDDDGLDAVLGRSRNR